MGEQGAAQGGCGTGLLGMGLLGTGLLGMGCADCRTAGFVGTVHSGVAGMRAGLCGRSARSRLSALTSRAATPNPSPPSSLACPGGGIGRRAGFRCQWPQGRGSSSLLLGTIFSLLCACSTTAVQLAVCPLTCTILTLLCPFGTTAVLFELRPLIRTSGTALGNHPKM